MLDFIRQFRLGEYAIFDFVVAFFGIYLLSPLLTKLLEKVGLIVPKRNWLFLVLPMSVLIHFLVGNITPMTKDFFNLHDNYILKIIILISFYFGVRDIKLRPKK